jgi:hypothetical protein
VAKQQVTGEKITVSKADICRMEETEKPRYPKHLDVGRIIVKETPEEKQQVIKRDVLKSDEVKPRYKETEVRYETERLSKPRGKEDVVTVGGLDVTEYHKKTTESERVKHRKTYPETLRKQKVCY